MRILLLNPYLPPPVGGIEKEMLALAVEFRDLGHEVTLLTTTARFPRGEAEGDGGVPEGVRSHRLDGWLRSTLRGFAPSRAPLFVPGLARKAEAIRPDLTVVFNAGWGPTLRRVLRRLRATGPVLYRTYLHPPGGVLRGFKLRYLAGTIAHAHRAVTQGGNQAVLSDVHPG